MRKSRTQMYKKGVQPTQSRIHCTKPYTNVRKIRTTYAKPHTLRKAVHKHTQNPYNIRKAANIAQSRTQTYAKRRTTYTNLHTFCKAIHKRTQNPYNIGKAAYNCANSLLQMSSYKSTSRFKASWHAVKKKSPHELIVIVKKQVR